MRKSAAVKQSGVVLPLFDKETMDQVKQTNVRARVDAIKESALQAIKKNKKALGKKDIIFLNEVLRTVCKKHHKFTTDDLWDQVKAMGCKESPLSIKMVPSIMNQACKRGWCKNTQYRAKSRRKSRHQSYVSVYESLIQSSRKERHDKT